MSNFETCSHCGEFRAADGHDSQRCWTIAHALANHHTHGRTPTDADRHIAGLSRWLAEHPSPTTSMGRQARRDIEQSLNHWITVAQTGGDR